MEANIIVATVYLFMRKRSENTNTLKKDKMKENFERRLNATANDLSKMGKLWLFYENASVTYDNT